MSLGGEGALNPKQYARLCQMRSNTKMQLSTQCRECGTINISEYVNNFLSTNPTTLILCVCVGGGGGDWVQGQGIKERGERGRQSNNSHK